MSVVFLAGASRGVGREIAKQLIAKGHQVIALLRSKDAEKALADMGITVRFGDALDVDAVKTAVGAQAVDVVISTVGGVPSMEASDLPDYLGNKNLIDAAVVAKAKRFILISSIGSGDSAIALPPNVLETLGPVLKEKAQAEDYLVNSGLDYTVIRPGGLVSEAATDQEILTADVSVSGSIPRAGVARLAVACMESGRAQNQILSAIDLSMQRTEGDIDTFDL
ncbi:SDR family oxidoreductase [cf. Phormidesmis sp. LEGE 11477]|uniref:SDR family oxidoreductase n=1 Tax=cf. Phormidesmis sp. LEGE 11477 TaxID=1828680 RepID=UPI00187FCB97|nr:SDR family oxidoreductase [cf. Phormidesmis sp. LEGE 11477]MBE9061219.1 SDR family oxidoreductase [cf. Phormidesmis sp. LEGE 11477]